MEEVKEIDLRQPQPIIVEEITEQLFESIQCQEEELSNQDLKNKENSIFKYSL